MRGHEERVVAGMTCGEVLAVLSDFLDGELDAAKRQHVIEHLRGCDWCERFGGRFSEIVGSLRGELAEPAPLNAEVAARLRSRIANALNESMGARLSREPAEGARRNMRTEYGIRTVLDLPFADAVERTKRALQEQGFGVLSEIDLQEKLREKIGAEIAKYLILGACNPPLAYRALQAEPEIGLLLPCNVIVYEAPDGKTVVAAVDPDAMLAVAGDNAAIAEVGEDARRRLKAVIDSLPRA